MKKLARGIAKGVTSLALTAASATVAGACYEHGRKIGKGEAHLAPEKIGSTAHGLMTKLVMRFVESRANAMARQAKAEAESRPES